MINDPTPERLVQDERLRAALTRITTTPILWRQGDWLTPEATAPAPSVNECGTAGCLAGWMVHDAGLMRYTKDGRPVTDVERAEQLGLTEVAVSAKWGLSFARSGQELAGLPEDEAHTLFDGQNTLATLWELTAQFTDGRVKLPPELSERVRDIDEEKAAMREAARVQEAARVRDLRGALERREAYEARAYDVPF